MRAHLSVSDGLLAACQPLHTVTSTRLLHIKIEAECLVLAEPPIKKIGSEEDDFQHLVVERLMQAPNTAALLLIAMDDHPPVLIKYLPLTCPVREKMLYSSSVADLRRGLAIHFSLFETHELEDMSFLNLTGTLACWRATERGNAIATAPIDDGVESPLLSTSLYGELAPTERAVARNVGVRLHGMSHVPFTMRSDVREALVRVLETRKPENWMELALKEEKIIVIAVRTVPFEKDMERQDDNLQESAVHLSSLLPLDEPRFLVFTQQDSQHVFVFYCPQTASIKQKFTFSAAKSTLIEALGGYNIFDRIVEATDPNVTIQSLMSCSRGCKECVDHSDVLHHPLLTETRPRGPKRPSARK